MLRKNVVFTREKTEFLLENVTAESPAISQKDTAILIDYCCKVFKVEKDCVQDGIASKNLKKHERVARGRSVNVALERKISSLEHFVLSGVFLCHCTSIVFTDKFDGVTQFTGQALPTSGLREQAALIAKAVHLP